MKHFHHSLFWRACTIFNPNTNKLTITYKIDGNMIETIVDELIFFPLANEHIIFRKSLQ